MYVLDTPAKTPQLTWQQLTELPTLDAAIIKVSEVYDFCYHPYFLWMENPATTKEEFRYSQLPFRFAVESFSQALAAVLAKIPTLEARLPLFANIAEEHGYGHHFKSHKYTFRQYLLALGATDAELEISSIISVVAFNQSILNYCLIQSPEAGATLLGIIEYLYVNISANIASTLQNRAWALPGSQSHYATHKKIDTEHARDLLSIAAPAWGEISARAAIAQSLVLGAHYFWSLYNGLLSPI